jgi:hypothetical protein
METQERLVRLPEGKAWLPQLKDARAVRSSRRSREGAQCCCHFIIAMAPATMPIKASIEPRARVEIPDKP